MDNFGWEISSSMMPPNIWVNQYETNNICGSETNYQSFQNSNAEMQAADNSSMGIDRVNEMLEMFVAPANFDSINNNVDLDNFLPTYHQPEMIPALDPLPENLPHSSQEFQILNTRVNNSYIGSCNFSSGESEAASQASSQTNSSKQRRNSKRKLEDMQSYTQCESTAEKGFQIYFDGSKNSKRPTFVKENSSANIDFKQEKNKGNYEADTEAIAEVKEMIYKAAAMRPLNLVLEETVVDKPKRKNVKISSDPQTVAARQRRERISQRLRVLQRLVPGGSKMDTASMLHEAANYLKFLKSQVSALETLGTNSNSSSNNFQSPFLMFCKMDNPS